MRDVKRIMRDDKAHVQFTEPIKDAREAIACLSTSLRSLVMSAFTSPYFPERDMVSAAERGMRMV